MINRESRRPATTDPTAAAPASPRTALPEPSAPPRSASIVISAETLVTGIAYHLVERDLATAVDEQAARHALARLKRQRFTATVARATWQQMSDAERLQWLLAVSDTAYALRSDDVAILKRRTG
jgi:hypothetical protein